jgi:hypothetical protein
MPLTHEQALKLIKDTVISSITNFTLRRINTVPNFQILDLIIPVERKIRSVVGGLETSLGTTLWEPLAKNLARTNGFEVINEKLSRPTNMPAPLQSTIQIVIEQRKNREESYNALACHTKIKDICQSFTSRPIQDFIPASPGFGVDIWLKKDGVNYFFDTKTVQSNVGGYTRYFEQIITWYAYYYAQFPTGSAQARIVFPYNPYKSDFWSKTIAGGWPLEPGTEGWVENEFWDFCSGLTNTYEIITLAFNEIAESGDLEDKLHDIFYS